MIFLDSIPPKDWNLEMHALRNKNSHNRLITSYKNLRRCNWPCLAMFTNEQLLRKLHEPIRDLALFGFWLFVTSADNSWIEKSTYYLG
jgi:hypothetical protein